MLVKICGLTREEEALWVSEAGADLAGFILFYPKSKRNISCADAKRIIDKLSPTVKPVAVTVSPSFEMIKEIEATGFSYIQIHGSLPDDLLNSCKLPVIKAFNVNDLSDFDRFSKNPKVAGYVFDAAVPGSGQTFDWSVLDKIPKDDKWFLLAGGLNAQNVAEAIRYTNAPGVDTSSAVENPNGIGKNKNKIFEFVKAVKNHSEI